MTFTMRYTSPAEREVVRRAAAARGITVAELVRRALEAQGIWLPGRTIAGQRPARKVRRS